ncbi:hypothetical protein ACIQFL_20015 [Bacillus toyonensis]
MKIPLKKWCLNRSCGFEEALIRYVMIVNALNVNGSMMNQIGANER